MKHLIYEDSRPEVNLIDKQISEIDSAIEKIEKLSSTDAIMYMNVDINQLL